MKLSKYLCFFLFLSSCNSKSEKLPILGNKEAVVKMVDGKQITDTLYHQIPDFEFINQDSSKITQKNYEGKIYVADFFLRLVQQFAPR